MNFVMEVHMSLHTSNSYGEITITEDAVASVAGRLAMDCYGVVDKVPRNFSDACADMFKRISLSRGVKSTIKYGLESFTWMIVDTVNVHVVGIRL